MPELVQMAEGRKNFSHKPRLH